MCYDHGISVSSHDAEARIRQHGAVMDSLKSDAIPAPDMDDAAVQIVPLDHSGAADEWARRWQVTPRRRAFVLRAALVMATVLLVVIVLTSNTFSIGASARNALSRLFPAA